MKEFFKRLFMDTPSFFKKVRNIGLIISGVGGSLMGLQAALPVGTDVPSWLMTLAGKFILIGTVMTVIAQAAVSNPEEIKK